MPEIVYILTNESMPGYVKIGVTTDLERRIKELDNTSVPLPFECFYACIVKDMGFVEKQLHEAFANHRIRDSREFFKMSPIQAMAALKLAELKDITPDKDIVESEDDQIALDRARSRKPNFNFKLLGIPTGSVLVFTPGRFPKPEEEIKAIVVDDSHIKLGEEITTVSAAAMKLTNARTPLQGTLYWTFEGESLDDRRNRIESE
jgi:hypothetical protein